MGLALLNHPARLPGRCSVATAVLAMSAVLAAVALTGCGTAKHAGLDGLP